MQYHCLVHFDPQEALNDSPAANALLAEIGPHSADLQASGHLVMSQPLDLPQEAITVRMRDLWVTCRRRSMRWFRGLTAALMAGTLTASLACAAPARAAPGASAELAAEAAQLWRRAAETDVAAAYALIAENHPGAAPEVGDNAFRSALSAAHRLAAERAAQVATYEGYTATLGGFADALGDKHVWSIPAFLVSRVDWAGVMLSKRGGRWVVVSEDASEAAESLLGASLVACDGRSPDDLGRASLGAFRVDWSVGAQQVQAAPWLLVDDHNPFVTRPKACVFDKGGRQIPLTLTWRPIRRDTLAPRIAAAVGAGAAGLGVRQVGEGYWIGLQTLLDPAAGVVAEVEARADTLRRASFVVLDLRGDSGGSSIFGDRIAAALMGQAHVAGVSGASDDDCDAVWRTSDGNLAQLQYYVDVMGPTHGAEFTRIVTRLRDAARAARAKGQAFSGPLTCGHPPAATGAKPVPSAFHGPLVLVTDNLCFSSCLAVTNLFRKLGALHVGQTTDAATHYTEVREVLLPSGLSKFSTLQAVAPAEPPRYGPFEPAVPYEGDIADTAALERWVVALASDGGH